MAAAGSADADHTSSSLGQDDPRSATSGGKNSEEPLLETSAGNGGAAAGDEAGTAASAVELSPNAVSDKEETSQASDEVLLKRRLREAVAVNKQLHAALVKKKLRSQELVAMTEALRKRIRSTVEVQEPAQLARKEQLEQRLQQQEERGTKAAAQRSATSAELEAKAAKLADANAQLSERSSQNRLVLKEQQAQVKILQRRIREVERVVAGYATVASLQKEGVSADARISETPLDEKPLQPSGQGQDPSINLKQSIEEYRQMPGLDLQQLLKDPQRIEEMGSDPSSHPPAAVDDAQDAATPAV